jgi:hypothetical protein
MPSNYVSSARVARSPYTLNPISRSTAKTNVRVDACMKALHPRLAETLWQFKFSFASTINPMSCGTAWDPVFPCPRMNLIAIHPNLVKGTPAQTFNGVGPRVQDLQTALHCPSKFRGCNLKLGDHTCYWMNFNHLAEAQAILRRVAVAIGTYRRIDADEAVNTHQRKENFKRCLVPPNTR